MSKKIRIYQKHELNFSTNWNNKLACQFWSTLRAYNPDKYVVGNEYDIYLSDKFIGKAKLVEHKKKFAFELSEMLCCIDTGYYRAETLALLKTMYKKEPSDLEVSVCFFTWCDRRISAITGPQLEHILRIG